MNSQTEASKRFVIKTLGCKVNQYESQAMREILTAAGFVECAAAAIADIYIVNTCTVTRRADKESRYAISSFHKANPNARIVVTGCYTEKDAGDISFLPGVEHIVPNSDKNRIADILNGRRTTATAPLRITGFKDHTKAFVKIQDGCANFCSYCKVPLVRKELYSRPIHAIADEVETLAGKGFREMVLTGVCLGAWESKEDGRNIGLADVLRAVGRIKGDFRVRLSSIEPKYVTDELLETMAADKRFCRHLHIPFQSGDDGVLKRMNRPYTSGDYRLIAEKVRAKIAGTAVTTDILVGFPGESEKEFANTIGFVKDIAPSRTHIFTYSRREGTAACGLKGELDRAVMRNRFDRMRVVSYGVSYLYRKAFREKILDVLVESSRDRTTGMLCGYTDNYIKVHLDGPESLMKRLVQVRIKDLNLIYTLGEYAEGGPS